jgi:hypothetical protein
VRLQIGSADNERASCAPVLRGRICGYKHVRRTRRDVKKHCLHELRQPAPHIPKNSAGQFLAVVPITDRPRQPLAGTRGWFPIFRCRMSGIESGILAAAAEQAHAAAKSVAGIFRPIFGRVPAASGQIGETPGVASDPPGWTCVLYLRCTPVCQARHFWQATQRGFWPTNHFCKRLGQAETGTRNREVGAIAPLRLAA